MEMGMNVMKMIMEICSRAQPILETISRDGATPELAMLLLTIHQDLEKDYWNPSGHVWRRRIAKYEMEGDDDAEGNGSIQD